MYIYAYTHIYTYIICIDIYISDIYVCIYIRNFLLGILAYILFKAVFQYMKEESSLRSAQVRVLEEITACLWTSNQARIWRQYMIQRLWRGTDC
jgi:phosphatidylinositol kinase/protein kinase (PI-3  family)